MTSSIKKSYEMVMLALSQKWPVLLYGPPGAGKSALINKIASDSHNQGGNCFCGSVDMIYLDPSVLMCTSSLNRALFLDLGTRRFKNV